MKRKFKVLLTRRLHDFALDKLRKKYEITVHSGKIPMPKNRLLNLQNYMSIIFIFVSKSISSSLFGPFKKQDE